MNVIEIALKRTTLKQAPSFEYINNIIKNWHERNLKTPEEVNKFLEDYKKQNNNIKELKKTAKKTFEDQRKYDNLDFLYANNDENKGDN